MVKETCKQNKVNIFSKTPISKIRNEKKMFVRILSSLEKLNFVRTPDQQEASHTRAGYYVIMLLGVTNRKLANRWRPANSHLVSCISMQVWTKFSSITIPSYLPSCFNIIINDESELVYRYFFLTGLVILIVWLYTEL